MSQTSNDDHLTLYFTPLPCSPYLCSSISSSSSYMMSNRSVKLPVKKFLCVENDAPTCKDDMALKNGVVGKMIFDQILPG
ncbi:unnamed protein product [Rotaria socialis]|uniref:Uncharacterized protein n=1 Tax=Rotaria socialis TaxID=392032 RepID=A0A818RLT6_9BILA|nr:unnamed protein product [Rotaria socialis]CAF3724327.1 unnamed protein product [Rotaria socialis]